MAPTSPAQDEAQPLINVTVFGNSASESCWTGGWRPIRSSAETFDMVSRALEREYGTDVSMQYIELSKPETRNQHKDILKLARSKYLRFPLVMLDGEVVFHGSLDYYYLAAIIVQRLKELQNPALDKDSVRAVQQK